MVTEIQVEAAFDDGTRLAVISAPFGGTAKDAAARSAIAAACGRPVGQLNLDKLYGNGNGNSNSGAHCVTTREPGA
ncbi:hypothetical protein [Streptomyces sp. NPDC057702]|uniref:hypothetical protein n=1 Tax=unclassified Streptomyces TaxID=2593676 RepID=UPI0036ACEF8C